MPPSSSRDYKHLMAMGQDRIEAFIAEWRETGGSELANTQSFIHGLTNLLGVDPPRGAKADDTANDYVFERRVFQDNGDGTSSFGRIDCYKRGCFILEAKQGSEADRAAVDKGEDDLDIFGQTAKTRVARGTARRGTPGWAKAMVQAKGQAERYAKALPIDHGWPHAESISSYASTAFAIGSLVAATSGTKELLGLRTEIVRIGFERPSQIAFKRFFDRFIEGSSLKRASSPPRTNAEYFPG